MYGVEPFEQQRSGTAGVEGVKRLKIQNRTRLAYSEQMFNKEEILNSHEGTLSVSFRRFGAGSKRKLHVY